MYYQKDLERLRKKFSGVENIKENYSQSMQDMFVWAMKQPNRKVKDIEYEITDGIYDYWKN